MDDNNYVNNQVQAADLENEGVLTFKNVWLFIKKAFIRIVIYAAIAMMITSVILIISYSTRNKNTGYAAAVIEFDFPGIENGLDPYGQKLDVSVIKSYSIINATIAQLNFDIDADQARYSITVNPLVPDDIAKQYENISKLIEEDFANISLLSSINYFPTKYRVEFNNSAISPDKARQFLNELINQYTKYFTAKFYTLIGYNCNLINETTIATYDFTDMVDVYEKQLDKFMQYVDELVVSSKDYKSFETNLSLSEISLQATVMRNYDVATIRDYIEIYNVTKQTYGRYRDLLAKKKRALESEKNILKASSDSIIKALDEYEKDKIVIIISPETGEPVQVTSPTNQYDYLKSELVRVETAMASKAEEVVKMEFLLEEIKGFADSQTSDPADIAAVNGLFTELNRKYNELAQKASITINNYYNDEYMSGIIKPVMPAIEVSTVRGFFTLDTMLILLVAAFVGLGVACIETGVRINKKKNKPVAKAQA